MTNETPDAELREENKAIARRYLNAINAWDFEAKREMLAEDVVFELPWAPPGFTSSLRGVEEVMAFLAPIPQSIVTEGLYDYDIQTLHDDPGEVICFYKSDMEMVEPVEYKNEYVTRFTIREGRIVHFREFFNPIPLLEAFGGSVHVAPRHT